MDEDQDITEEENRAAELRAAQAESEAESEEEAEDEKTPAQNSKAPSGPQPVSIAGGALFAAIMFFFFDIPKIIIDLIDLVLPPLGSVINYITVVPFGWLTIYIWLKGKGHSIFDAKGATHKLFFGYALASLIPIIPGFSGFVITFLIRERARQVAQKVPGAGKLVAEAI